MAKLNKQKAHNKRYHDAWKAKHPEGRKAYAKARKLKRVEKLKKHLAKVRPKSLERQLLKQEERRLRRERSLRKKKEPEPTIFKEDLIDTE